MGLNYVEVAFDPGMIFLGVLWVRGDGSFMPRNRLDVWVGLVPCLPIHVVWHFRPKREDRPS